MVLAKRPIVPKNPARQQKLGKPRDIRAEDGVVEYEVTSGSWIWYCSGPGKRITWVAARTAQPELTG